MVSIKRVILAALLASACAAPSCALELSLAPVSPTDPSRMDRSIVPPVRPLESRAAPSVPRKFDLRELGAVTAVKTQTHNDCWAFSSLGSVESIYMRRTGHALDLSERHLELAGSKGADRFGVDLSKTGAFDNVAVALLARWSGPVLERDVPYSTQDIADPSAYHRVLDLRAAYLLDLQFREGYNKSDADVRKRLLMEHGAVSVGISSRTLTGATYFNAATNAGYCDDPSFTKPNHAVLLCGWDDDFPIDRFNAAHRPTSSGAWLVKNSWGVQKGAGGFFWVSYEDVSLCDGVAFIAEAAGKYDKNYGWDALGWSWSAGTNDESASFANVFTSGPSRERVGAVSLYATSNNAEYKVSLYTGLSDAADPTSGTLAAQASGTLELSGYHTVDLPTAVKLEPSTKFAAVIEMRTPGYMFPIAIEAPIVLDGVRHYSTAEAEPGESFLYDEGAGRWVGVEYDAGGEMKLANACVRAFSTLEDRPTPPSSGGGGGGGCEAGGSAMIAGLALMTGYHLVRRSKRDGR